MAEPSQFHNSHFLHVSDRKSVLNVCCIISAHRIATSYGPDCLDPFLHYHDTLIRANVDWLKFKLRQFGSICPSIKKVRSRLLNVHALLSSVWYELKRSENVLSYLYELRGSHKGEVMDWTGCFNPTKSFNPVLTLTTLLCTIGVHAFCCLIEFVLFRK